MHPKLLTASLDADCAVTVRFSRRRHVDEWSKDRFSIGTSSGSIIPVTAVQPVRPRAGRCTIYLLTTPVPLHFRHETHSLHVENLGSIAIRVGRILSDASRFYDPAARLGATWSPASTTFGVFAPTARSVHVVVADEIEGNAGLTEHLLERNSTGIWETTLPGDLAGKYYAYKLTGPGFDPHAEITDIYATCAQGRRARSLIVDLAGTDPPGFRTQEYRLPANPADAVIYEMHVRDFTIAANSGVINKGKHVGLTESNTHLPDHPAITTGLDHLVELGITHVQLMPVQDFDNDEHDDDWYNWGYMPAHFNSPDGWYATSVSGPARIRELKQAIQAFHQRGIGVILDVVYNHTSSRATFESLVPGYYFRLTREGRFANGSCCGNEFDSEKPMAGKFILDSVRYWIEEYRIDGFRFDMMGLIDLKTMREIKAELESIRPGLLIYGEPWAAGRTPLERITNQKRIAGTGIAAFNDHLRDAIKGNRTGAKPGFIQTGDRADGIRHGFVSAIHDWSIDPIDVISYFECHDDLTAWDKLLKSTRHQSDDTRKRMMRLAALILFASQGTILLHAGQEFCRTKKGSANSYNLPDEINQVDWSLKRTNHDLCEYHQGLIALRKAHPVFRLRRRDQVESRISFPTPPNRRSVICLLDGSNLPGEPAEKVLVLLNGRTRTTRFDLPEGQWNIHADANRASTEPLSQATDHVTLPPHSGMMLMR